MNPALTIKQVAELLNVNERTVYRLVQAGELPAFRVSGSWRFLESDLVAWIEDRKREVRCGPEDEPRAGSSGSNLNSSDQRIDQDNNESNHAK